MKNKLTVMGVSILFLAAAFFWAAKFYRAHEKERLSFLAANNFSTFVKPHSQRIGKADAKVYLVEFLDPECESCREFYPFVKELIAKFDGKVQLVVRYAPFHGNSIFAVKILEAAKKQDMYWETLGLLFQSQPYWGDHHAPKPELIWEYLPSIGLDVERIKKDMEDPAILQVLELDLLDVKELKVQGTPTFFVNGKALESFGRESLQKALETAVLEAYGSL